MSFQDFEITIRPLIDIVANVQSCYSVNKVAEVSNYQNNEVYFNNKLKDFFSYRKDQFNRLKIALEKFA